MPSVAKVFFDSDALIAGSASRKGAAFVLLQLSELSLLNGLTSKHVVTECKRNLQNKLPGALPAFEKIITNSLTVLSNPSAKGMKNYVKMAQKKDLPILTSALEAKAKFLVTFNIKDFYPDDSLELRVISPGDLLKKVRAIISGLSYK